jgi:hypothetical protein
MLGCALSIYAGIGRAEDSATVNAVSGTAVVQKRDGSVRSIAPGSTVQAGDVVITQPNSSARFKFTDGSEVSVAANSQLRIEAYSFDKAAPQKDNLVMGLLKGGLRTITGLVGKRGNRDAYKLQTSTATIGIRGTEFIAALCDEECAKEADKPAVAARANDGDIVARMARLAGEASATDKRGTARDLKVGSPIYEGEVIETRARSHAVLVFADEGRVTLQPETRFAVERFRYAAARPEEGSSLVRLLKGGMRVLTGLIGKRHPQGYQVQTVTATIGIRGTGFDAFCTGSCTSSPGSLQPTPSSPKGGGLFVNTWQDEVVVQNAAGSQTVGVGQTVHVASADEPPLFLPEVPEFMRDAPGPRPDGIEIDFQQLFGVPGAPGSSGLYVLVKDGIVLLVRGERLLELERGESAFAGIGPGEVYRLAAPPPVLQSFERELPPLAPPGSLICTY